MADRTELLTAFCSARSASASATRRRRSASAAISASTSDSSAPAGALGRSDQVGVVADHAQVDHLLHDIGRAETGLANPANRQYWLAQAAIWC